MKLAAIVLGTVIRTVRHEPVAVQRQVVVDVVRVAVTEALMAMLVGLAAVLVVTLQVAAFFVLIVQIVRVVMGMVVAVVVHLAAKVLAAVMELSA